MMNDSTRVLRRPRQRGPRPARTAAAIIATATLALLAAGCSGSPSSAGSGGSTNAGGSGKSQSPNAGGSANSPSAVGYSNCMRSNGVPNFPDPPSSGRVPKTSAQQLGVASSQYQAAQNACQHLLPVGANDQFPPAEVQLLLPVHAFPRAAEIPRPQHR
jgi:hypothetical protein